MGDGFKEFISSLKNTTKKEENIGRAKISSAKLDSQWTMTSEFLPSSTTIGHQKIVTKDQLEIVVKKLEEKYGGGKTLWHCKYCSCYWMKPFANCPNCNAPMVI